MTSTPTPHFLLFSEARSGRATTTKIGHGSTAGTWRFVLEAADGSSRLEVVDGEPESDAERLELLAVVRGLESLDQPSRVTLITRSQTISRGLRFGLPHWRENEWQWENFGRMTPVKDVDLWRRVDCALQFHEVQCRTWRFDQPEGQLPRPVATKLRSRLRKQTAVKRSAAPAAAAKVPANKVTSHGSKSSIVAKSPVRQSLTQRIGTVLSVPWQAWRKVAKGTQTSKNRVA